MESSITEECGIARSVGTYCVRERNRKCSRPLCYSRRPLFLPPPLRPGRVLLPLPQVLLNLFGRKSAQAFLRRQSTQAFFGGQAFDTLLRGEMFLDELPAKIVHRVRHGHPLSLGPLE